MLKLNETGRLKHFKNLLGQNNHYLITILIGLEGVRLRKVSKDESFNVKWNPKSIEDSVTRSRRFARNAGLSWAIDSIDSYLGFLKKDPFSFPKDIQDKLSERSIYCRLKTITDFCKYSTNLSLAIVHLGIQWRNNLIHYHADNELEAKYRNFIEKSINAPDVSNRFCSLDLKDLLSHFDKKESPKFKEVASIIQSIHDVITELDKILVNSIDLKKYCLKLGKMNDNTNAIRNILASNPSKKMKKFKQFLLNNDFIEVESEVSKGLLSDCDLEEILTIIASKRI
ncbi:MAG: hypothetical protein FWG57_05215 [Endomicrobia bacterium]|nr:hypothetical protein [Endomicrobiia bacterium]